MISRNLAERTKIHACGRPRRALRRAHTALPCPGATATHPTANPTCPQPPQSRCGVNKRPLPRRGCRGHPHASKALTQGRPPSDPTTAMRASGFGRAPARATRAAHNATHGAARPGRMRAHSGPPASQRLLRTHTHVNNERRKEGHKERGKGLVPEPPRVDRPCAADTSRGGNAKTASRA